jgi:hypothetical protein
MGVETKIKNFLSWITPDAEKRAELKELRDKVRENIKSLAKEDGLIVLITH